MSPANPYATCPLTDPVALAAQYDNNASPRNRSDLQALRDASAAAYQRRAAALETHRFGPAPWQSFDLFRPAGARPRQALVFVHGGRWQLNTSRETAFWAGACCDAGALFAGLNFPTLQDAGLLPLVDAVAQAVHAALSRTGQLDVDPASVCLAGHSSGAHLALAALLRRPARVGSLLLLGGLYDLQPLGFGGRDVVEGSPLRVLEAATARGERLALPPALVAAGAQESPEFLRQSRALHWALQRHAPATWHEVPGAAHFDAALEFNQPQSVLRRFALDHGR